MIPKYYYKIQPPLPIGQYKIASYEIDVKKSNSKTSICVINTPVPNIVQHIIKRLHFNNRKRYKVERVNESYFKIATQRTQTEKKETNNLSSNTSTDLIKELIKKAGATLSNWITEITSFKK